MSKVTGKIIPRYMVVVSILALAAIAIVFKMSYTMFVERDKWTEIANNAVRDSVIQKATRGRILSSEGQLMASSLPEYKIQMDFKAGGKDKDSILMANLDSICLGLSKIIPQKTPAQFRERILQGREKQSQCWTIYTRRISYTQFKDVQKLPLFNLSRYKSGFIWEEYPNRRKKPFGSLASRTLGSIKPSNDSAVSGLEQTFDSILRGTDGFVHRQKVRNRWLSITDVPPVNGADVVTTIDVSMQDICEQALEDKMKEINANIGVVILMEVATGDVKAIVNLGKQDDGSYFEDVPHAISDMMEPGSTFKTASMMVALDNNIVKLTDKVDTGSGIKMMHGSPMKDHNWHRGGYGTISVPQVLMYSSNVGTSTIIDGYYYDHPEDYVQALYNIGIAEDLKLPFKEYKAPRIRMPKKDRTGKHWANWSKTALAWMSIGYETQIAPINIVTFYNAIANNGKMMRPRFVKRIEKDGEVITEYPPEVIKPQICKPSTIEKLQKILRLVVKDGVAKKAGTKQFHVSGKTGTAQISQGKGGYRSGTTAYLISFCGFFPSENPRYTCIVCMQKKGSPASGGTMCGPVFRSIAEKIYAKDQTKDISAARDTVNIHTPEVKDGDILAASYLLNSLEVNNNHKGSTTYSKGNPVWGTSTSTKEEVTFVKKEISGKTVPNVIGMGARDALYLMESCGLKVSLEGHGKVYEQSIYAGSKPVKGAEIKLRLK